MAARTLTEGQALTLDWLRGLSAQVVLIGHVASVTWPQLNIRIQDAGVVAFFVLSGFLIGHTRLRKGSAYTFSLYLIDRGARIFTAYIPALALILLCGLVLNLSGPYDMATFMANLFMLQDFPLFRLVDSFPSFDRLGTGRPLWSVAMEWWFYVGFGIVAFWRPPLWSALFAIPAVVVVAFNFSPGVLAYTWFGAAFLALAFAHLPRIYPWRLLTTVIALLALYRLRISPDKFYDLGFNILSVALLGALLMAVSDWRPSVLSKRMGRALAAFSYSLYLTHYMFLELSPGIFAVIWANILAILMWFLFERHHKHVSQWAKRIAFGERYDQPKTATFTSL